MKVGVLGTGIAGRTLATRLAELGHEVTMGSRSADNEDAAAWAAGAAAGASHGTFADAAEAGEVVVNATAGGASLDALAAAGPENLAGKLLIDVANALDFSAGFPPTLSVFGHDSLGEQIQRAHPDARVVKALNTMNCEVMVDPARVPGAHNVTARRRRHASSSGASAGRPTRSSTWATSRRRGAPRPTCSCGCASTAPSAPAT
jgi:hypothetical protein